MLQIGNHSIYWISVEQQEAVVVADGVEALQQVILGQAAAAVALHQGFSSLLLPPDVALNVQPRPLSCSCAYMITGSEGFCSSQGQMHPLVTQTAVTKSTTNSSGHADYGYSQ